jgi:hypothetical protein
MSTDLSKRLEQLERRMNEERPAGTMADGISLLVVVIHGALPPGEPLFANAGAHQWLRGPAEGLDEFADRARAGARELKETLLVVGGLPVTEEQNEAALRAYDIWAASDDGIPPVETRAPSVTALQRAMHR